MPDDSVPRSHPIDPVLAAAGRATPAMGPLGCSYGTGAGTISTPAWSYPLLGQTEYAEMAMNTHKKVKNVIWANIY